MAEREGEKMFGKSKFEKVFGFKVSVIAGMHDIEIKKVYAVLHSKAENFSWACGEQNKVFGTAVSIFPTEQEIKEREEELKDVEERISRNKKSFWDAHALAKTKGFTVKDSYKDYLDMPS